MREPHGLPPSRDQRVAAWLCVAAELAGRAIVILTIMLGLATAVVMIGLALDARMAPPALGADRQCGVASYYAHAHHGRRTASGERFDMHGLTAASPSLPFGTMVRVTRPDTGADVTVRINDRGPAARLNRIIDLSLGAAEAIGMVRAGVVRVCLEIVGPG